MTDFKAIDHKNTENAITIWKQKAESEMVKFMKLSDGARKNIERITFLLNKIQQNEEERGIIRSMDFRNDALDEVHNIMNENLRKIEQQGLRIAAVWATLLEPQQYRAKTNEIRMMTVHTIPMLSEEIKLSAPEMAIKGQHLIVILQMEDENFPLVISYKDLTYSVLDTSKHPWEWSTNMVKDVDEPVVLLELITKHQNENIRRYEHARYALMLKVGGDNAWRNQVPVYRYLKRRRHQRGNRDEDNSEYDNVI